MDNLFRGNPLPRFQQTRGILRLLALWVSHAYQDAVRGRCKEPLIGIGSAPLEDSFFRQAVFEQLGGAKLEGAVTTDIWGRQDAHAEQLDAEATETIKEARLHRKVATTIFFESGKTRVASTSYRVFAADRRAGSPSEDPFGAGSMRWGCHQLLGQPALAAPPA